MPNVELSTLGSVIKTAYEAEPDRNAFTDNEKSKLAGIAAGAEVNTVTSVAGKTGNVTLAKADVGLANVDNTADANKPVSTATQTALDLKVSSIISGITGADQITNMVSLTQAEYDSIVSKSAATLYVIVG